MLSIIINCSFDLDNKKADFELHCDVIYFQGHYEGGGKVYVLTVEGNGNSNTTFGTQSKISESVLCLFFFYRISYRNLSLRIIFNCIRSPEHFFIFSWRHIFLYVSLGRAKYKW